MLSNLGIIPIEDAVIRTINPRYPVSIDTMNTKNIIIPRQSFE